MWTLHEFRVWSLVLGPFTGLCIPTPPAFTQEKMDPIDVKSVDAILSEETREGRAGVMSAHTDLLSRGGVFAILKRGEYAVNAGQHALAMRACDAADEIVEQAGLDPFTRGISGNPSPRSRNRRRKGTGPKACRPFTGRPLASMVTPMRR